MALCRRVEGDNWNLGCEQELERQCRPAAAPQHEVARLRDHRFGCDATTGNCRPNLCAADMPLIARVEVRHNRPGVEHDIPGHETTNANYARGSGAPARRTRAPRGDRKSTRLNSSHLGISYAVFCLKKKNQSSQQI